MAQICQMQPSVKQNQAWAGQVRRRRKRNTHASNPAWSGRMQAPKCKKPGANRRKKPCQLSGGRGLFAGQTHCQGATDFTERKGAAHAWAALKGRSTIVAWQHFQKSFTGLVWHMLWITQLSALSPSRSKAVFSVYLNCKTGGLGVLMHCTQIRHGSRIAAVIPCQTLLNLRNDWTVEPGTWWTDKSPAAKRLACACAAMPRGLRSKCATQLSWSTA